MKKALYILWLYFTFGAIYAQEASTSYNILLLPSSSHSTALGGENISNIEDAPSVGWSNPALLSSVSDNSLGVHIMSYINGSIAIGAQYVKAFGDRHTATAMMQMLNYGKMDETDEQGVTMSTFSPKDLVMGFGYSYLLSEYWSGGATLKMTHQAIGNYRSLAMGLDLGLNYFDPEKDLSVSATIRNAGMQLKALYDGDRQHLPFQFQVGLTKRLEHLPLKIHITLTDLTRWKNSDYYQPDNKKMGFGRLALNHLVLGIDLLPTNFMYLSLGYNARRGYELGTAGAGKWAGLSAGAGFHLKKFNFGAAYAKYHLSSSALMFNASYSF